MSMSNKESDNEGGGASKAEKAVDSAESRGRAKFPFWTRKLRYVIMLVVEFAYWGLIGLVMSAVFAVIVGPWETLRSIVGFVEGMQWAVDLLAARSDLVMSLGMVYYAYWMLDRRELLNPERPAYENPGRPKWQWLVVTLPFSLGFAGVLAANGLGFVSVSEMVVAGSAVGYFVSAYFTARTLTSTLREDNELASWFGSEFPWKYPAWLSLSYGVYAVFEGGVSWIPELASAGLALATPVVGVAYLVRRGLGVVGVWDVDGRLMSRSDTQATVQGEFDEVDDESVEEGDEWDDPEIEDEVEVEGFGMETEFDSSRVKGGFEADNSASSEGVSDEADESSGSGGEDEVPSGAEREFDDEWDEIGVDESASSEEEDDDDQWEYDVDDV